MSYEPLEYLNDQIATQIKNLTEALAEGSAKDFAQYQNAVGRVQGLLLAQSLVQDLARRMEESDD